jgi:hypothetical protein
MKKRSQGEVPWDHLPSMKVLANQRGKPDADQNKRFTRYAKMPIQSSSSAPSDHALDIKTVLSFLEWLRPSGPWLPVAIAPDDGTPIAETTHRAVEVSDFIGRHDQGFNLYYSVNPTRTTRLNKKARKVDIATIEFLFGDLDPNEDESSEQAKARYLRQLNENNTSAVIDSGNGLQGLWRLQQSIVLGPLVNGKLSAVDKATVNDVEARMKALMQRLGSKAGTQNIDRILRLPGTVNLPNAAKLKLGREVCPTKLLWCNGATFSLDDFPASDKKSIDNKANKDAGPSMPDYLASLLHVKGTGSYKTRSELFWAFINMALRRGIDEEIIISACLDPAYGGNGIFEHVRDQKKDGRAYLTAQIEHALNNDPDSVQTEQRKYIIRSRKGFRHEAVAATQKALLAAGCPVFFRGDSLVQPVWRFTLCNLCGSFQITAT